MTEPVFLYVYDLSQGMARQFSPMLLNRQIDGVWHTAVVVYGVEYAFGQGVEELSPGHNHYGVPVEKIHMGDTMIPKDVFLEYMEDMKLIWTADKYHLFENNCNSFSNEVCQFLVGRTIPSHITGLPQEVLSTPFGQMIRPMIENMYGASRQPFTPAIPAPASEIVKQKEVQPSSYPSVVRHITDPSELQSILTTHPCVAIDFTSQTCGPCRVISPEFERILGLVSDTHKPRGKMHSLPRPVVMGVSVEISKAPLIAQQYQISATPTFMFFLKGEKFHEFKGADVGELKSNIELLAFTAFPPHDHGKLDLKMLTQLTRASPVHFMASSKATLIVKKLKEFIASKSINVNTSILESVGEWLETLDRTRPLPQGWKPTFNHLLDKLDVECLFPLLDLVRLLIAHSKEGLEFFQLSNTSLPSALQRLAEASKLSGSEDTVSKSSMMIQRCLCNLFSSEKPIEMRYLKESRFRSPMISLVVETLLSPNPQLSHTSSLLLYNIGWSCTLLRDENAFGSSSSTTSSSTVFDLGDIEEKEAWQLELVAAVCQAIEHFVSLAQTNSSNSNLDHDDHALRLIAACGFLVAFSSESILELVTVVGVKDHILTFKQRIEQDKAKVTDDKTLKKKADLLRTVNDVLALID